MYSLVERDTLKSVLQNIRLVLSTPKGSDVHRPEFGSDLWELLDKPLNALTVGKIRAELVDAIETWEPRAKVKEVQIIRDYPQAQAKIRLVLEVEDRQVETWV